MAQDLLGELRSLQDLLRAPESQQTQPLRVPSQAVTLPSPTDSEADEPSIPAICRVVSPPHAQKKGSLSKTDKTVTTLRRQVEESEERCGCLQAALSAAQQDCALVAARLQTELSTKQEENTQLADMVLHQREEIDSLKAQQLQASQQVDESSKATLASIGKLQEAAAEWRRRGEDSLQALAAERERATLLQQEGCRLRGQVQDLTAQLGHERRQREASEGELAVAKAKASAGSTATVAELQERLGMERGWRKAVGKWLKGEVQTRQDLERVLLNVSSAVRCGAPLGGAPQGRTAGSGDRAPSAVRLPARRVAASQPAPAASLHVAATRDDGGIRVTVSSPTARLTSVSSTFANSAAHCNPLGTPDWRQHLQSSMIAFDERHARLQQELNKLQRCAW